MTKKYLQIELLGILFIVSAGSLLHFCFAWSGYWRPLALIAAVNESVWEHLKLAFWPGLFWAVGVFFYLRPSGKIFCAVKGLALLIPAILIILIFYGYTSVLGKNYLILDIGTFVFAVIAGQIASVVLMRAALFKTKAIYIGMGLLFCQLLAYSLLTYYPPNSPLFIDSRNGSTGIILP